MTQNLDELRGMGYLMGIHNRAKFPFISVSLCHIYLGSHCTVCDFKMKRLGVLANENYSGPVIFHSSVAIYFKPNVPENRSL